MSEGTAVRMPEPAWCDLCKHLDGQRVQAVYDCALAAGSWAYVCEPHKRSHGVAGLGVGIAQRLIYPQAQP